ncbi:MAG: YdiU family protein [Elainella sp. Prado103]|jgi:uncharacterized protein YdiU (UPF0061 family)|nr:YdiU family protein [Elainella sp. Prado103]
MVSHPHAPNSRSTPTDPNPLTQLPFEAAFESLGAEFADPVAAAEFPRHILRFRNDQILPQLGLTSDQVTDADFVAAFGEFRDRQPLLAMRYHGYQFGEYNPALGDGRGFLYGQVRGQDGELYDFGTKGSGRTPYSRTADGRLTLKGGVREVLAAEMLHRLGVRTSRCFSLVETGEQLWRGDEPSPTRSSVMVRFSRSHIRFGTFERLHYLGRKDLIQILLDHVIQYYYPHLQHQEDAYLKFYTELVQGVADLTAQWMTVGFCHAVLNTDNMAITAESFDYGPYGFINQFNPSFTAAYFDYSGRYCYGNQPSACLWNLQMLQVPLKAVLDPFAMEQALTEFESRYQTTYRQQMLRKLGFEEGVDLSTEVGDELLRRTLKLLWESQVEYHGFFKSLRLAFQFSWRRDLNHISLRALGLVRGANLSDVQPPESQDLEAQNPETQEAQNSETEVPEAVVNCFEQWRQFYYQVLQSMPESELPMIARRLSQHNPLIVIVRPEIEAVWEAIDQEDNWIPFNNLLQQIWGAVEAEIH